jgi:hypothetical protein
VEIKLLLPHACQDKNNDILKMNTQYDIRNARYKNIDILRIGRAKLCGLCEVPQNIDIFRRQHNTLMVPALAPFYS